MDIALLVIFLITDWSIVGIFAAVYGGKHRYREGMIFGVHVPESAVLDKDTAALTAHYRKVNRNFYIINLAAGTGAALLSLGHLYDRLDTLAPGILCRVHGAPVFCPPPHV